MNKLEPILSEITDTEKPSAPRTARRAITHKSYSGATEWEVWREIPLLPREKILAQLLLALLGRALIVFSIFFILSDSSRFCSGI